MRLKLMVRSYCDQTPTDTQARTFDSFPVIIGRSTACDYCLYDPSRYISSNHAVILLENDQLLVEDSSANGVYINAAAEPVGRGRKVVLNHADSMTIGDYTLTVSIEHSGAADTMPADASDDPFNSLDIGHHHNSTVGENPSRLVEEPDPFKGDEPDWTPPSASADDPFLDDWGLDQNPQLGSNPSSAQTEDDWADWPTIETPAVSADQHPASPTTDEFDWLPDSSNESGPMDAPVADNNRRAEHLRQIRPQSDPANVKVPQADVRPPMASAQTDHDAHIMNSDQLAGSDYRSTAETYRTPLTPDSDADIEALLRAASLSTSNFKHRNSTEVLEQTGRLLAQMVDAIMILLESRNELKHAIRSDVTTLSRRDNNPLKFSINATDALTKLLADDNDGFLKSDLAVREAVDDLKLHQLAMLDGMKSAVKSLLIQFDPAKLSKTLEKSAGISANIPIAREAKLWELFCEQHEVIREEAVNNFSELFGDEFRKAYEKRTSKTGRPPDF